jgi:hypothetical protein
MLKQKYLAIEYGDTGHAILPDENRMRHYATQEILESINNGDLDIFRISVDESGEIRIASAVVGETEPEDDDEETEFEIVNWQSLG